MLSLEIQHFLSTLFKLCFFFSSFLEREIIWSVGQGDVKATSIISD